MRKEKIMVDFNIERLTTPWNDNGSGKVNSGEVQKPGQNCVWNKYKPGEAEFSEQQMEEIYENGRAYVDRKRNEGAQKYAEIEKARTEATSNGVSYDEAIATLDNLPDANFGVVRDETTGELRKPTIDEIYEHCKNNPDDPQSAATIERIDKARQAKNEFESKYPDVTSNDYNNYRLFISTDKNFGV